MSEVKYPEVTVQLTGRDGNAFAIMGAVKREMRRANLSPDQIQEYLDEARSGDYDHLLQVTMKYVNVE